MKQWNITANSEHILRIIQDVDSRPKLWKQESKIVLIDQKWVNAWNQAYDVSYSADWRTAWDNAQDAAIDSNNDHLITYSAQGAILALMTWTESSKYLTMPADQALFLSILNEDPAFVLIFPAVKIFSINK